MAVKVGSAGQVIDSVIQYPQGGRKSEAGSEAPAPKKRVSHSAGLSTSSDRVVKSSEMATSPSPVVNKAPASPVGSGQKTAPLPEVAVVDANGEPILENRTGTEMSEEAVKIAVDDANKRIAPKGANIEFSFHEKTGRYSFKVVEQGTGKVLREVPPEKSLDMVAKMFEMVGLIVDEKL